MLNGYSINSSIIVDKLSMVLKIDLIYCYYSPSLAGFPALFGFPGRYNIKHQ